MGRECFEELSHHDCQEIYDQHQKEIIEKAKHNFQVGSLYIIVSVIVLLMYKEYMQYFGMCYRNYCWSMQIYFITSKV